MSHNFARGDLVQIQINDKNYPRGWSRPRCNGQMGLIAEVREPGGVIVLLFTGDRVYIEKARLKKIRSAPNG